MMKQLAMGKQCVLIAALALVGFQIPLPADPAADAKPVPKSVQRNDPKVSLGDDALTAMKSLSVAPGLKIDLYAAEPLIQNVVSFAFDEKGRAYVVETHRRRTSVYDIRNHRDWIDHDYSFRTVDDRIHFLKRNLVPENKSLPEKIVVDRNGDGVFDWRDLEVESERIRLVEDRDGDGRADHAVTFSDGYSTIVSGVAAGVLARKGDVWFTCIPDVWKLRDTTGDGVADKRELLHHGFGVHIAYGGHDMHGLKLGPDGKLYWSIADRGAHVVTKEGRTIAVPDTGAIFRSNPDGTEMEVVATGLRNPQELTFDSFGNLFTGDNNADGGDKARWIYVVEGGDYGWTLGWQWLPKLGAWNSERLWELEGKNTSAHILPPIAHIGHGPGGIAYYPGTGLPEKFNNHFFYADFPGGIRHFQAQPKGAWFSVDNPKDYLQDNKANMMDGKLVWGLYPVDIDFGPHGGAYVLDWVTGWEKTGKGRIFRIHDPETDKSPILKETWRLLGEGMEKRSLTELAGLLDHRDQRVRQEAQFELAARAEASLKTLSELASDNKAPQLARIHAIWALGQIGTASKDSATKSKALQPLPALLTNANAELRAQAAKILGDARETKTTDGLIKLLKDPSPRVRFFAAMGLGKIGSKRAIGPVTAMLRDSANCDPYLRHAGVMALTGINDLNALLAASKDASPAVRLAVTLAMRRLESPEIARFLNDSDPLVVLEAARAINDTPIPAAAPKLASLKLNSETFKSSDGAAEYVLRRVANAHFRLGSEANARALATLASDRATPESVRAEAVDALGDWPQPPKRDRVTGLWSPLEPRDAQVASNALGPALAALFRDAPDAVRIAAAQAAEKLNLKEAGAPLFDLVSAEGAGFEARIAALKTLASLKDPRLDEAVKVAAASSSDTLRKEAGRLRTQTLSGDAIGQIAGILEKGTITEKQTALAALAGLKEKGADDLIRGYLDQLLSGKLAKELHLELLTTAAAKTSPSIKDKLAKYQSSLPKEDPLSGWREVLFGGDAAKGKQIFYERAEAGCYRCHKVNGDGGEVGPELAGILSRHNRDYLLESIIFPNRQITPGYENIVVNMKNGVSFAGVLKGETETELLLDSPEDGPMKLKKADIASRNKGLSSMPEELGTLLSRQEMRDLVEFLASLK